MSIIEDERRRCGVCGTISAQPQLLCASTYARGDLDLRPSENYRSTMRAWVQACPACSYRGTRLRFGTPAMRDALTTPEYVALTQREDCPPLARDFACVAFLEAGRSRFVMAGWAALRAAWVCDDADSSAASGFRAEALASFRTAHAAGKRLVKSFDRAPHPGLGAVLRVDLARRLGRFDEARAELDRALNHRVRNVTETMLLFERHLVDVQDIAAHTVDEAGEWRLAEAFRRVGPIRTLGGAGKGPGHETYLPATPPPSAQRPTSIGIRPTFYSVSPMWLSAGPSLNERYGRKGWQERSHHRIKLQERYERERTAEEIVQNEAWIATETKAGRKPRVHESSLADEIDALFADSGEKWETHYGDDHSAGGGWRNSKLRLILEGPDAIANDEVLRAERVRYQAGWEKLLRALSSEDATALSKTVADLTEAGLDVGPENDVLRRGA